MEKISVVIITKNEEKAIRRCLDSIKDFDEIVIADSGSSDDTLKIAAEYTEKTFIRDFDDFSSQKNFALSKCRNEWVLSLDADEVVSDELKNRIGSLTPNQEAGFRIRRQTYIFKKLMKHGGHSKDLPLRLINKNRGRFVQPIHEFFKVEGEVGLIEEPLMHYSSEDLGEYFHKFNLYTDLEADFMQSQGVKFSLWSLVLKPPLRFFQRYWLQKGFLDKLEGFLFYTLSGFNEFVKWVKYWERLRGIKA